MLDLAVVVVVFVLSWLTYEFMYVVVSVLHDCVSIKQANLHLSELPIHTQLPRKALENRVA